jgi:hypothetical protein
MIEMFVTGMLFWFVWMVSFGADRGNNNNNNNNNDKKR